MKQLIEETLKIAKERFISFGFSPSQIEGLLTSAERDLTKVIIELETLITSETASTNEIDRSLHALKGLLYNMGNMEAGDLMIELKNNPDKESVKSRIKEIIKS